MECGAFPKKKNRAFPNSVVVNMKKRNALTYLPDSLLNVR